MRAAAGRVIAMTEEKTTANTTGFSKEELLKVFRLMALSRTIDEKMDSMLRQGKAFFHIGAAGHEAAGIAAAMNCRPGKDWAYPYYRDQPFCLALGYQPKDLFLNFLAKKDDLSSGGKQMAQHYGSKALRIVSQSSSTGTQYLQAVGVAMGIMRDKVDEVVYVSSGEGATSQGDFHEALNWASRERMPVVFHIENNRYAISVPVEDQTAGGSVYKMIQGYEGLAKFQVDGTDFFAVYDTMMAAVKRARMGAGPSVVVSDVVRLMAHSSSDDPRKYRSQTDIEKDKARDPLKRFIEICGKRAGIKQEEFDAIREDAKRQAADAGEWASIQSDPDVETADSHVYASRPVLEVQEQVKTGGNVVMVDAINHALSEELQHNPKMLVYGEDVAGGKGGVFAVTRGLTAKHGPDRVFNSPLAESSIIGTAAGLAAYGYKPVVEIQFGDYIWPGMMQLRNEIATMRYRSNGVWTADAVIRVPVGGYIHGGLFHSQSIEAYFTHTPGLYIAYPSNAADAKGLLKSACRMKDPVLFLEHKGLYRQGFAARPEPLGDCLLPFGKASVVTVGSDLTVVTWGMMVQRSIEAVAALETAGASVEIIDARTLNPFDWTTVRESVKKTGKVLIVHEDCLTGGFGAEIAARLAEELFENLDAPIKRVGAKDCPVPFAAVLEERILPQVSDIATAVRGLLEY